MSKNFRTVALTVAAALSCGVISAGAQASTVTLSGNSVQAVITDVGVLSSLIFDPSGTAVQVTAKVLNSLGQPIREIDALQATPRDEVAQFGLPLSWLVPGEYQIELMATNTNGSVRQRITFKLTG